MKAKIWCEVTCGCCGDIVARYYGNSKDIAVIKDSVKDWRYTEKYGNTCPDCLKKMMKVNKLKY